MPSAWRKWLTAKGENTGITEDTEETPAIPLAVPGVSAIGMPPTTELTLKNNDPVSITSL